MKLVDRLDGRRPAAGGTRRPTAGAALDLDQILARLHTQVVDRLDIGAVRRLDGMMLLERVAAIVDDLLVQHQLVLTPQQRDRVVKTILDEIVGLGPIEALLADPTVSDILINGSSTVYIERNGLIEQTLIRFRDDAHLLNTINRIVARVGRRIDESSPMVDARLPDGSRVNAIIPPLAVDGPVLCIRRFGGGVLSPEDIVRAGTLSEEMMHFLRCAVIAKCNILVSGGTGAGKTTLLNALSSFIPHKERILTIEDAAELRFQQEHVVRLETRPPNIEGRGEVTIRDLVRNGLRMRPDRIVVGEVRSVEVLDMLQAMNTGHEGSMTTIHANSADDALTRLVAMLGMAGTKLSETMMLQMVARSIHLVVQVARHSDGRRRVITVAELGEVRGDKVALNPVFAFEQVGLDDRGQVQGHYTCSGTSGLLRRFRAAGVPIHPALFGGGKRRGGGWDDGRRGDVVRGDGGRGDGRPGDSGPWGA
jgi:pilus assembly protein CpaF